MRHNQKRLFTALLLISPSFAFGQDEPAPAAPVGPGGVTEYEALLKETDGLRVYSALLERQIEAQQQQIADLQASVARVPELERQIPPLLIRMIEGLEEFVRLDVPFLTEERTARVAELQLLMESSGVTDAEKFRRILEAWQIETEYGGGFATYVGQLDIDGTAREVDFLQIGRVALLYQTTDEEALTGAWDVDNRGWVSLANEHRNSVGRALRMARNQIAPELVLLPIRPAEMSP